jgi:hypothetical protein
VQAVPARGPRHVRRARHGTALWSERAGHELRTAGERSGERRAVGSDILTAQELQTAQLAADGLANREIGKRLYIKIKITVPAVEATARRRQRPRAQPEPRGSSTSAGGAVPCGPPPAR